MKASTSLALTGALLAPWTQATALELTDALQLELNAGLYSDYRSRGISQSGNDPALQGSATLLHASGLYAGLWSSNVDFAEPVDGTRQELDYYAGYYWQIDDDIALDIAYVQYAYPRQSDLDYGEYQAELSAYGAFVGGKYANDMAGDQSYLYSYLGYRAELPWKLGLELRYGQADYKDPVFFSASGDDRDSYHEWEARLNRSLFGLDWSLGYVDTDLSEAECASFNGFDDVCSATLVLGVGKTF